MPRNYHQNGASFSVSESIRLRVGTPPFTGGGVHQWIFNAAFKLRDSFPEDEIYSIIRASVAECGRPVPDREIQDAIRNSSLSSFTPSDNPHGGHETRKLAKWPAIDPPAIATITAGEPNGLARLQKGARWQGLDLFSPPHFVAGLMSHLFPGDVILCAGESLPNMRCRPLSEWAPWLASLQFIVPSPMTALRGSNLQGQLTNRSLDNTGERRFLVIEFDSGTLEHQAGIHIHLSRRYPLALCVWSGSKSLHGWYYVQDACAADLRGFMAYAVSLGADPHTWTRCQPVRMPGGLRLSTSPSPRQIIVYFNPNILPCHDTLSRSFS